MSLSKQDAQKYLDKLNDLEVSEVRQKLSDYLRRNAVEMTNKIQSTGADLYVEYDFEDDEIVSYLAMNDNYSTSYTPRLLIWKSNSHDGYHCEGGEHYLLDVLQEAAEAAAVDLNEKEREYIEEYNKVEDDNYEKQRKIVSEYQENIDLGVSQIDRAQLWSFLKHAPEDYIGKNIWMDKFEQNLDREIRNLKSKVNKQQYDR